MCINKVISKVELAHNRSPMPKLPDHLLSYLTSVFLSDHSMKSVVK